MKLVAHEARGPAGEDSTRPKQIPTHLVLGGLRQKGMPLFGELGVKDVGIAVFQLLTLRFQLPVFVGAQAGLLLLQRGVSAEMQRGKGCGWK